MPTPNEARELLYRLIIANSPYTVSVADYPAPLPSLDAAGALPWPAGTRNVFVGDELAFVQPATAAWASLAVRHNERESISMARPTFDVRGNVQVAIYTPLGRQSAEAYGFDLAYLVARVLDPNPSAPLRFSDGTALHFEGSRIEALPLAQKGKWHRFAVEAPFRYEDRA